jgi:hypothetical protein
MMLSDQITTIGGKPLPRELADGRCPYTYLHLPDECAQLTTGGHVAINTARDAR